ncbi:secretion system protein [Halovenus sp. WSH3]|uniref:Secretion system protein n=1 Tax=Halovenus carboxidivorans TaxID=2692199 RepID=A0A6B0T746_9EURY|nr:type II/IV secretion system ATPase subunit [Halovenus carboxidivorans]MXR50710.1 secretion system protein [Halovenus carboxidivorans]
MSSGDVSIPCDTDGRHTVPPPLAPDDPEAWYAEDVQSQYEVHPGVVVTIARDGTEFRYDVREPALPPGDRDQLERMLEHFSEARLQRPLTREGAVEAMDDGFAQKHETVLDRLLDCSAKARQRIGYHALAELACLSDLTPYALDDRIEVADTDEDGIVVHTTDYAPAVTDLPNDPDYLDRFASERIERYTVDFHDFEIPVIRYRTNLLGDDPFSIKYAVREPDLLPGDEQLIAECKERIWETAVDGIIDDERAFVRDRAAELLARRLRRRDTRAWLDALDHRLRSALAEYGLTVPPVDREYDENRLEDLVYYVLRDYVAYGKLTIPIRDPRLEDIEANRVGERIKVVPRDRAAERVPTNLAFEDEQEFVNVVTQLAAADGMELNATRPSAKVNLSPDGIEETIRCAVALPTISEDGPHISIRKQASDALTPVDLVERNSIPTELVALLWLCYEHHRIVLFSGPTGVGKTTLLNAHMPFIPFEDRPISIDEGSREVRLPHETGVSLTTRDHESEHKRVTMADLMTECNYLNPDVEVIAEINTSASFQTFAESINTGHGILGTTHATDIESLVNRAVEQGLPPYLLREVDLVVFPRKVDGERYVGEVVELLDEESFRALDRDEGCGVVRKDGGSVYWNRVAQRTPDGTFTVAYDHPDLGDDQTNCQIQTLARIADLTDRERSAVEAEFHRKHRYVEHMVQEGIDEFEGLFELLADLQTNEAATVERLRRQADGDQRRPGSDGISAGRTGGDRYSGSPASREVD